MNGINRKICKSPQRLKRRHQLQYDELLCVQKSLEQKMLELDALIRENTAISQEILRRTKEVIYGALSSALLGVCIVLAFEIIETGIPYLKGNFLYTLCKALGVCVFTMIYILRRVKK